MSGSNGKVPKPRKLTRGSLRLLEEALRQDYSIARAATLVGIGRSTLFGWLAQARRLKDEGKGRGMLLDLLDVTSRARARWEADRLGEVLDAAKPFPEEVEVVEERLNAAGEVVARTRTRRTSRRPGDWRAAAWLLARRLSARYGLAAVERATTSARKQTEAEYVRALRSLTGDVLSVVERFIPAELHEQVRQDFSRRADALEAGEVG
jgi:transposase-like protein